VPKMTAMKTEAEESGHRALQMRQKYTEVRKWIGNNRVFCSGRVISASEFGKLFRTAALVGIPSILFGVFVASRFWLRYGEYYVMLVGELNAALSLAVLMKTAFTDPGIIPRRHCFERRVPPTPQDICVDGRFIRLKFCSTCKIIRPPRAFHCDICNNCVERFDHHCPWIGTCIGLRNYRWFSCFVWLVTILCAFVFYHSVVLLYRVGSISEEEKFFDKLWAAISEEPMTAVIAVYVFVVFWLVFVLCGFHIYLVTFNKTTYEQLRKKSPYEYYYNTGLWLNIRSVCCTIPGSSLHLHHKEPIPDKEIEEIQKKRVVYVQSLPENNQILQDRSLSLSEDQGSKGSSESKTSEKKTIELIPLEVKIEERSMENSKRMSCPVEGRPGGVHKRSLPGRGKKPYKIVQQSGHRLRI